MKVDCDIPGLSVSCLNSNVGKGSLWVAERATSNPNIYEVSTAWDWGAFTQDEMKAQLGIYDNLTFVPHYYMASSNARGVMAIAKRMATGGWEYSSKSADVVMNNILHLDKEHLWFVGCNPALQVVFSAQAVSGCLWLLLMEVFCSRIMSCITPLILMLSTLKKGLSM